jgi:predicted phosphodiesterase
MKVNVQLLSDIHLEFFRSTALAWIQALDSEGVDILVLAGDICTEDMLQPCLAAFCDKYSQVVFVAGNHEYYGSSPMLVTEKLAGLEAVLDNFTWLNCNVREVMGLTFVGGTLWFPKVTDPSLYLRGRMQMNDFRVIQDFEPWVYEENRRCEAILHAAAGKADIVVTHHIPSGSCIAPRYRGSYLNHFFCRDLTRLIEEAQPKAWLFGHTHDRMWTYVKDTKLICNPKGYPNEPESKERGKYVPKLVMEFSHHRTERADLKVVVGPIIQGPGPGPGLAGSR